MCQGCAGGSRSGGRVLGQRRLGGGGNCRQIPLPARAPTLAPLASPPPLLPQIWVVYEVDSVFQNYRRYVRSYDPKAMHNGLDEGDVGVSACDPFRYITGEPNASFPNSGAIQPCGQISQSLFNDTFSMTADRGGEGLRALHIDTSDIAWSSDANDLYGDVPPENFNTVPAWRGGGSFAEALNQAQAWMVWQRPSAKPVAAKLYGRIDTDLPAGTVVSVTVANRYNSYAWQGQKNIILTTNSWVGGRNLFLGAFYIVVAGLAWALGGALFAAYTLGLVSRRAYGDLSQLSWVRRSSGTTRAAPPVRPARVSPANAVSVTAGPQGAQVRQSRREAIRGGKGRVFLTRRGEQEGGPRLVSACTPGSARRERGLERPGPALGRDGGKGRTAFFRDAGAGAGPPTGALAERPQASDLSFWSPKRASPPPPAQAPDAYRNRSGKQRVVPL